MAVMSTLSMLSVCLIWANVVSAQQPIYAQCGGTGWTGGTTCVSGTTCQKLNDFYYQCLPGSATSTTTAGTTSIPVTVTTTISASTTAVATTTPTTTPTSVSGSTPTGAWATAITKAKAAVAKLTLDQKVSLGTGVMWQKGHCVGNTPAVSSINFPGLCLQDSPLGVRYADKVSVFPAGINVAATFNRDLMQQRGAALGAEFKGKGVHVALGPAMNIARAPAAGRNWESFGADPYLAGEAAYATITGIQSQGVQACAKHYINNEQEHFRETSSSNVDDRTQHEIYLPPVRLPSKHLKRALTQRTVLEIRASRGGELHVFIQLVGHAFGSDRSERGSGHDNARYLLGQDSGYPAVNFDSWNINSGFNQHVNVQGNHATLIRTIGAASTVLLKNKNSALPLKTPSTIGVIGNDAGPNSQGINGCSDRSCNNGVLGEGWGSGTAEYPYLINPLDAIKTKASSIGATVTSSTSDTDLTAAATAARGKDVALVFISADSGEGYITVEGNAGDRNDLKAWHNGDALVAAVAAVNKNTIVVVHSVGQIIMEPWIDHVNVTAVLWAGLQGQEAGNAVVDVLWGAVNPSGRLPYTIAKSASDYSASVITNGGGTVQIPYAEGLKVDYRAFDTNNITPRFEFGFGLSYTTFNYSNLVITPGVSGGTQPTGPGSSLSSWLQDPWVKVSFTLKNTGSVAGTEVPQLYISPPSSSGEPPNALKGFSSVALAAGASTTVSLTLSSIKKRLDVREAKEHLRKAYRRNPNPSDAQLKGIAEDVGRSVSSIVKWFERERSSSKTNTPEPTTQRSQAQEFLKRDTSNITTNGLGKRPARPTPPERGQERSTPTLKSKQQPAPDKEPAPDKQPAPDKEPTPDKQPAPQPAQPRPQPAQSKPVALQETSSSVASPSATPPQAIPPRTTPQATPPRPQETDVGSADQPVTENEQSHPFPHAAIIPVAFEGVTKLQHELHCAMALYYQATQGLPMSYPEPFSR
ncbi:hypothetical protein FRC06_011443 [Ceratobasidium sp. 370]|nr:hypothetical protein FRC06_011443 [Ceratobasidium sp. 370]